MALPVAWLVASVQPAAIADIRAAIACGVGIEDLSPIAAPWGADFEFSANEGREIADNYYNTSAVAIEARKRQNAVVAIVRDEPAKAVAFAIEFVQGRNAAIGVI